MKTITLMRFGMMTKDGKKSKCTAFYCTPVTGESLRKIWTEWNTELKTIATLILQTDFKKGNFHTTSVRIEFTDHDMEDVLNDSCSRLVKFRSTGKLDEMITAMMYCIAVCNGGEQSEEFDHLNPLIEKIKREKEVMINADTSVNNNNNNMKEGNE